jgi:hypothetical protein
MVPPQILLGIQVGRSANALVSGSVRAPDDKVFSDFNGVRPKGCSAPLRGGAQAFFNDFSVSVVAFSQQWTDAQLASGREPQQFPSIKNGEIPSKHFCELVRAAEKVGHRGGVPSRASRGPNAAFVERHRDRFKRG